ncbi:hypothetical protein SAMN02745207_02344 [Clostridium grantii DSM 8605]|uniref:CAAX protease self-immunity n=1 Tax=Clostridium grantii DSM 8605 TaxID=1121316 RepID=A0A1M5VLR3_9CLOT|nr:hypothetical protein SAMN02745207_02344 [Clostridium grantii DSM 8605]
MKEKVRSIIYNNEKQQYKFVFLLLSFIGILSILYFMIVNPLEQVLANSGFTYKVKYNPNAIKDLIPCLFYWSLLRVMMFLGSWIVLRFIEKRDLSTIGLSFYEGWIKDLGLGLFIGVVLTSFIFIIGIIFGWIKIEGLSWNYISKRELLYAIEFLFRFSFISQYLFF